jgi:ribonuclease-3
MAIFDISGCESKIGYSFKDKMLLRTCFTHSSYANEHRQDNNELLEFFGDAILQFVVTEYLFNNNVGNEGDMTRERAEMVSKFPLLQLVKKMGLGEFILLGNGQGKSASQTEKLYSSVYEALVGGIYLDGGMVAVRKFIKNTLIKEYEQREKVSKKPHTDFFSKVEFQEYVQKHKLGSLRYVSLSKTGPDHAPEFREAVLLNETAIAEGKGKSRQAAQNQAARVALEKIKQGR